MAKYGQIKPGDYVRVLRDFEHTEKESPYFLNYINGKGIKKGELLKIYRVGGVIWYQPIGSTAYLNYEDVELVPPFQHPKGIGKLVLMSIASGSFLAGVLQMQDLLHDPLVQKALTGLIALIAALIGGNLSWMTFKSVVSSFGAVGDRHRQIKQMKSEERERQGQLFKKQMEEEQRVEDGRDALRARNKMLVENEREEYMAAMAAKQDAAAKQNMADMIKQVTASLRPTVPALVPGQEVVFEDVSSSGSYFFDGCGNRPAQKGDKVVIDSVNIDGKFSYTSSGRSYVANVKDVRAV
jgi:hypothetical protein